MIMVNDDPDVRRGFGSASTIVSRAFGLNDPKENADFVASYEDHRQVQDQRDASGFVDSIQRAERAAPNALSYMRDQGRDLDGAVFGAATGILPGHMSREALHAPLNGRREQVVAPPSVPEKVEATGFQAMYDKVFGKNDDSKEPGVTPSMDR